MMRFIKWLQGGERVDAVWQRLQRAIRRRWRRDFRLGRFMFGQSVVLAVSFVALLYFVPPRHLREGTWFPRDAPPVSQREAPPADGARFVCPNPFVVDGDTIHCGNRRIRLAGIDAPEMPGHCRDGRNCAPGDPIAARDYLSRMARGAVMCRPIETDVYGRTVARCEAGGRDLSCAMLVAGHAIRRYGPLSCI